MNKTIKATVKKVYAAIPFKQQLFSAIKIFWKPGHAVYQHLYFKGLLKIKIDNTHSFRIRHYGYQLENALFWKGITNGWEKISVDLWMKVCKNASVVIDIGANTGIYALIAKSVNPDAKVYAFEPVKRVFHKLQENVLLNKYDIVCIEKAVSNADGTAVIYDIDSEHVYSVTVNKNMATADTNVTETKIETITLDSFIKEYSLQQIDAIKIDVETHEPEVLEGFGEYLVKFKPTMLIEVLTEEVGKKIEHAVNGLGYLYFNIDEENGIRQVSDITKSDCYNYFLCTEKIAVELGLTFR